MQPTGSATSLAVPVAQPSATQTPEESPTPAVHPFEVCSPLEGISTEALPTTISNPYHPPRAGSDDPHHGLDFADGSGPEGMAVPGKRIQAVLPGVVAAVVTDRFPYGNALIVETPFSSLPADWIQALALPEPGPPVQPISLTCPEVPELDLGNGLERSLYLLYAHMQAPPALQVGDPVSCGQELGAVGSSGNALNPHLHLEVRAGPAGARLGSLAHYDASASPEEMAAYCAWRVRGLFQTLDPLTIFPVSTE